MVEKHHESSEEEDWGDEEDWDNAIAEHMDDGEPDIEKMKKELEEERALEKALEYNKKEMERMM